MPRKPVKKPAKKPSKTAAPKVRKTVENDEGCLQMHSAQWLKKTHPHLLAFHVANERKAAVQFHVKLKRMGVLSGVADWLVFPDNGRKAAIELKGDEGVQEPDQIAFEKRWTRSGGAYFLVRTLDEFKTVVNGLLLFS